MPAGLMTVAAPTLIPPEPDLARMRRDRTARIHAAMREQGLDALILLGNTNVVYATGAIWPLADSGRANFEQPVAVVLIDDEWPHLFSPMREDEQLCGSKGQHRPVWDHGGCRWNRYGRRGVTYVRQQGFVRWAAIGWL